MQNKTESARQNQQLVDEAMRSEIIEAVRLKGQPTLAEIVQVTGFQEHHVKYHCELLKNLGQLNYNWVCRRFSL